MGKPIIASNIEGFRCVLTNGIDGFLVPPKNDKRLAQSLAMLLSDRALRQTMGESGRQKAQQYSWKKIASRILELYASVINEQSRRQQPVLEGISE
jgi:phosphatidylinositol alpha-mannosyltransferase